jgi:LysR family transcriptional regulator for bpeEF and oprC
MDFLLAMRVVDAVGRHGGFAAAGRALKLSTPSVSRMVSEMEEHLGVRLFNRTTRRVSPTDAGHKFLRRGADVMEDIESLVDETRAVHRDPAGVLRVSCVNAFGTDQLAPSIPGFLKRYPAMNVELDISNRKVDLVNEPFDVAIRIGGEEGLDDTTLVARKIFSQRLMFVATPDYVEKHGAPHSLDALSGHRTVKQVSGTWGLVQHLRHAGETVDYRFPDDFVVNSPIAARNVVLTGYGCGLVADYLVENDIAAGRLVRLLDDYETTEQPIYAVFAHRKFLATRIRVFVDYLVERFRRDTE